MMRSSYLKQTSTSRRDFGKRFAFFIGNSNIHGLGHIMRSRNTLAKCVWVCVVAASAACLARLVAAAARGAQLGLAPDTRALRWSTAHPAVTVCEIFVPSAVQRKFTQRFPSLMEPLNYNYRRYLTNLLYGQGVCTKEVCGRCGSTVACDVPWRTIIEDSSYVKPCVGCRQIHKSCEELVSECSFGGAPFACCARFRAVDSEQGPCFAFNTLQSKDSFQEPLFSVNRSTGPGVLTFRLLSDARVSVHSPEELSTNNLDTKFKFDVKTREANWVEYLFSIVETENDPLLKTETIAVRNCRYLDEVPGNPIDAYPVYSYGACKLAQNTRDSLSECGCIHPARDLTYREMYCNFTGLNCLVTFEANKYKLGLDKETDHEPCVPSCTESELTSVHISKRWITDDEREGTTVNIRMSSLPSLRYERNLLRTNLDLVVSLGGIVGLLFGASALSVVEIFYLIFRKPY